MPIDCMVCSAAVVAQWGMQLTDSWIQRLWQPRRGIFWLMLLANGLSTFLVLYIHTAQPSGGLRWALSLLALGDTLLGWWLLRRLWRESEPVAGSQP